MQREPGDLWIFGYGSLMWQPGFRYAEAVRARLAGYHRALCIYSVHYRGSCARPGLVLGLDRGGVCDGVAFRVAPADRAEAHAYLRQRELIYGVYREASVPVHLHDHDGAPVLALTYIAERAHPHYAGTLPIVEESRIVRTASGQAGSNLDYLASTLAHLRQMGLSEPRLERTFVLTGPYRARLPKTTGKKPVGSTARNGWQPRSTCSLGLNPELRKRFTFRARLDGAR